MSIKTVIQARTSNRFAQHCGPLLPLREVAWGCLLGLYASLSQMKANFMENLLLKYKAGKNNIKLINWPGSEEQVAIQILNQKELQEARFETERIFKAAKIDANVMTADEYNSETQTQILYRCLRNPADVTKPIGSIIDFKASLTLSEKEYLIEQYNAFEAECSPNPENLSAEELDRIIQAVKKNPSMINGSNYSIVMLKKLITVLASLQTV